MEHPTATDWQNRCERAEAECKELRIAIELALEHLNEAERSTRFQSSQIRTAGAILSSINGS